MTYLRLQDKSRKIFSDTKRKVLKLYIFNYQALPLFVYKHSLHKVHYEIFLKNKYFMKKC